MQLTADQARAVKSWQRGDICVVAGPGSGKTRVLVERVRWLIMDREVAPERILAITFTEKAAYEMRSRLVADSAASEADRIKFHAAQISTIDAFCNRLLKEHALEAGVDPGFEILDEVAANELLHRAIDQVLGREFARGADAFQAFLASYEPGAARPSQVDASGLRDDIAALVYRIRSYGSDPFLTNPAPPLKELSNALSELAAATENGDVARLAGRAAGVARADTAALAALVDDVAEGTKPLRKAGKTKALVAQVKDELLPECRAAAVSAANLRPRKWLRATVRRVMETFSAAKSAAGGMDFDDALQRAADLLDAAAGPRLDFEHVLIDEFQDTNPLQVRLVERLLDAHGERRPVTFVVGDINQSIYGFRHADHNVFRAYRERVERDGGEVIRLSENFRSRPGVLAGVHRLLPGGSASGVEAHRLESVYRFGEKAEPSCEVVIASHAGERSLEREAAWIARRLASLKSSLRLADRGAGAGARRALQWGDIAILVRTHDRAARLAAELRRKGVPSQAGGGRNLFRAPETAELAAFLRVLRNPRDEISLAAVLKSAFCGVGDETLLRLKDRQGILSAFLAGPLPADAGLDAHAKERLQRCRELIRLCRADRAIVSARSLLARAISACGYRSFLAGCADGAQAVANLDRLLEWIGNREAQGAFGADAVSEVLDRAIESPPAEKGSPERSGREDIVEVLTMHAAKGLEFPVVVVAGLQADVRGTAPGLLFSDRHGIGARWREPFGADPCPDSAHRLTRAEIRQRESEESDRLLYVALTRAEEHLLLCASFPKAPQRRNWCKLLFDRLGIDPRASGVGEPEVRRAGDLPFVYIAAQDDPPVIEGGATAEVVEPATLRPLPSSAQADYSAAVTSVALFGQCPRKYFLSRYLGVDRIQGSVADGNRPAAAKRSRREPAPAEFGELVHRHLAGQLPDAQPAVRRLAKQFHEHRLGRRADRAERVQREMSFVFTVGEHLLNGTIDLLFEEGGKSVLVDYKTDRVPDKRMKSSAAGYAPQLQLYAAGLAKSGNPVDRAVLFYLRPGKCVDVDIGEAALGRSTDLVEEFFAAQRSQDYPLKIGAHCRLCPHFRRACPAELN